MILTNDNYYTREADMEYMSCSQYQGFGECEAKQLAKLQGRWTEEPSQAFLVGNFFHSYFEGKEAHEEFCKVNLNEIYSKTSIKNYNKVKEAREYAIALGEKFEKVPEDELELKAPFEQAVAMIRTVESDPLMQSFLRMDGKNEMFMTGEIFGTKWRMKMDKYVPDLRMIIDYKTVANIWETSYSAEKKMRLTFVETYGYIFRAAVYSMIEAQNSLNMTFDEAYKQLQNDELNIANFFLLCVSKQDYPDKQVIHMNNRQDYIYELENVKNRLYRYNLIKEGRMRPKRCGQCDYCRATKILDKVIPYYQLMPEYREQREEDYNAESPLATAQQT